jgi:hypothetical protein
MLQMTSKALGSMGKKGEIMLYDKYKTRQGGHRVHIARSMMRRSTWPVI